jgi:hypothetical protein
MLRAFQTYFLIVAISLAVSLYLSEGYLRYEIKEAKRSVLLAAEQAGYPIDRRTKVDVIDDLRSSGEDAWPLISPGAFVSGEVTLPNPQSDPGFFPLSGIPSVVTVSCSDTGQYRVYKSDLYGFANPSDAWEDGSLDIGIIGDSYAVSTCVGPEEGIAPILRRRFHRTVSVGMPNIGPLVELGILEEYLRPYAPRIVFWLFYSGNDMDNLLNELKVGMLQNYLDANYRQDLTGREAALDTFLRGTVERARAMGEDRNFSDRSFIVDVLSLRKTRDTVDGAVRDMLGSYPWGELERILAAAKERAAGWGGQVFFVYLPSYAELANSTRKSRIREEAIAAATRAGLPVVDVTTKFAADPDPLSLFPFRLPGHYTPEGYQLVADLFVEVANKHFDSHSEK